MFDNLSGRLQAALKQVRGQAYLREENIADALREVRMALLEADVALPVVRDLTGRIKAAALSKEVVGSLTPGQAFVGVVQRELTHILGEENASLDLRSSPPAVVLLAGLQGAGKTTTAAKLANLLIGREKKRVLLTSVDIYRPAAVDQLDTLANAVAADFFRGGADQSPVEIARNALTKARETGKDVLLVDTAGRLHIDEAMMAEIKALHGALQPVETLFVVDAMTGQDAANTAAAFAQALPLTGVVLTKADGDARGGAALSVRQITGKPIKFIGVGEKYDQLEPFHPERIASRILGMGDVLSLVEEVERKVDQEQAERLGRKLVKGKGFTLEDFRDQLRMIGQMGGVTSMLDKLPGMPGGAAGLTGAVDEKQFVRMEAIINSMTPGERRTPDIVKGSRKRRIAAGSGVQPQDVSRLLKQFAQMQKTMKKINRKGGMKQLMRAMNSLPQGRFPGH